MANPYESPGLPHEEEVGPPPKQTPARHVWARFVASAILLSLWATGAFAAGAGDDASFAWIGGPFWLMHETGDYAIGGTLAVVCLAGIFAAMVWPGRYTLAVAFVALIAWAGCSALAWAMWSGVRFHDTYFIFRIGW
jgi:hypothetical protein